MGESCPAAGFVEPVRRTESEHEQNHITAIANMELEDSAVGMLGPATSDTGRTRSQHSLLYPYRTVESIILVSHVLVVRT